MATLRDAPASNSPAPTDMAIATAWWGNRENAPAVAPTNSPTEDTPPHARADQTSGALVAISEWGQGDTDPRGLPRPI